MSSRGETLLDIDPCLVRFTHARVRPFFSGCGRRVQGTLDDLREGRLALSLLPHITVLRGADGVFFSLNNRRLWVLKELRSSGHIDLVRVRVKEPLPRELLKYTPERCSLTATIMREKEDGDGGRGEKDDMESDEPLLSEDAHPPPSSSPSPSHKVKPIHPTILKYLRQLQDKAGHKKAKNVATLRRQLDEWLDEGLLEEVQEEAVWALIRGVS